MRDKGAGLDKKKDGIDSVEVLAQKSRSALELRLKSIKDQQSLAIPSSPEKAAAFERGQQVVCGCSSTLNSHNHSYYSVLDGICSPEDMVSFTAKRGYGGIGITDHGTMGGIMRGGREGLRWKTGRLKSNGKLVNYTKVKLIDYVKKYELKKTDNISTESLRAATALAESRQIFYDGGEFMLSSLKLTDAPRDFETIKFRNITEFSGNDMPPIAYKKTDSGLEFLSQKDLALVDENPQVLITHDPEKPQQFKILDDNDFDHVGDFKVVSGCELYCSWQDQKHKKYNHITVYATGPKGHRALVLLTSIGSIPSRRFVGGRGFFRPRVFIEDIDMAIKEADGQLVVTTGCPISITSEAFRNGDLEAARRFFEWGKKALPKNRFFAELHICDVSLDFNRNFAKAEDKFYASIFNVPISRLRIEDRSSALKFAEDTLKNLRLYVLANGLAPVSSGPSADLSDRLAHRSEFVEGSELQKLYSGLGSDYPLEAAGIKLRRDEIFSRAELQKLKDLSEPLEKSAEKLLQEAMGDDDYKSRRGRRVVRLDEDSLVLLSCALKVLDEKPGANEPVTTNKLCAELIARFALFVIVTISERESVAVVNPLDTVRSILAAAAQSPTAKPADAAMLVALSEDRSLALDCWSELDSDILFGASRAIVSALEAPVAELGELRPAAGEEDDNEKQWLEHPEGNWMERVNRELVKMAKEYDVPLMLAADAHMTEAELKPVQDAVIKRGKRRAWHMSRPYAIPRSDFIGFLEDTGKDYHIELGYIKPKGNAAYRMLEAGVFTFEDLVEAFGSGSLLLDDVESAGKFAWQTVVPKIKYENHPYYEYAKKHLENGELSRFLSSGEFAFSDEAVNISTSLIYETFKRATASALIPDTPEYRNRLLSELYLMQEAPGINGVREELSDFFLVLQYVIKKWRDAGISVGPGRGSSGGMLTAHICGITFGDPIKEGFLSSRWMNPGRKAKGTHADIDIDVDDRQAAGKILAEVAAESMNQSVEERALSPLESTLHEELFFSSSPVTHEQVGGVLRELRSDSRNLKDRFLQNVSKKRPKQLGSSEPSQVDADSIEAIQPSEDETNSLVAKTPIIRVGTYGSLKAKAAVKEAVRIADKTPFELLPSFGEASPAWRQENSARIDGLSDEEINRIVEQERFGHLSLRERTARRRVRLGDRLTKAMSAGSGLARLYQTERDYFMGSVYGEAPGYWEASAPPPKGSSEAETYFKANPEVQRLVLNMLNIYKSQGVHAGGMCFGREVFERVPVRADKHGYVAQLEMGDIERTGILKFDVLGLETLTLISETLKLIVTEGDWQKDIRWWLGDENKDVYDRVLAGESPDYLWRHIPPSTLKAASALIKSRAMTFQVDTPVFGKELDNINLVTLQNIIKKNAPASSGRDGALTQRAGGPPAQQNETLLGILNALLALFRPGPMKLDSHRQYINRLLGAPYQLTHQWLEPFVSNTFGLIVYQEQVMAIYRAAAIQFDEHKNIPLRNPEGGYVLADEGETDEVRRALGKKKMSALRQMRAQYKFMRGLKEQGLSEEAAEQIWEAIVPFAEYGFNSPHSYHYGVVSALTLFLKGNFTEEFFRIGMALAKPDDAARFLGEIQEATRPACVLNSDELYWRVIDGSYFPGLLTVEGLKRREIQKILDARQRLKEKGVDSPGAFEFFSEIGSLTPAFAKTLSRSGSLRVFGSPEHIASEYERAVTTVIKPRDADDRAKKRERLNETMGEVVAPDSGDGVKKDLLEGLDFELRELESPEDGVKSKPSSKKTSKQSGDKKAYKLGKKNEQVRDMLVEFGMSYVDQDSGGRFLTVKSAYDIVTSNKTRGSGIRHLHAALVNAEFEAGNHGEPLLAMIKELKELRLESKETLAPNNIYRFIGIPKAVGSYANHQGLAEPRVTFLSEGSQISAKFSKYLKPDLVQKYVDSLKDGKMSLPFLVSVFAGEFSKEGRTIRYFKIEKIEKITLSEDGG